MHPARMPPAHTAAPRPIAGHTTTPPAPPVKLRRSYSLEKFRINAAWGAVAHCALRGVHLHPRLDKYIRLVSNWKYEGPEVKEILDLWDYIRTKYRGNSDRWLETDGMGMLRDCFINGTLQNCGESDEDKAVMIQINAIFEETV